MCPAHVRPAAAAEAAQRNWFLKIFHISIFRAPLPLLACLLRDCVGRAWFPPWCKLWTHIIIKATATATACCPCAACRIWCPVCCYCSGGRRLAVGQAFWLLLSPQITIKISWHCPGSLNVISGRRISVAVGLEIAVAVAVAEFCRNYRYLMQICVAYFVVGQQNLNTENNSKCFLFACLPFVFCAYVCRNQFFAPFCRRRCLMLIRFEFQHSLCRCSAPALPLTLAVALTVTLTRLFGLIVIIQAEKQICLQSTCT